MLPENIDPSLREAALRSFRESLSKATEKNKEDQAKVEEKEQELQAAIKQRDLSGADCRAYSNLIDVYSLTETEYIKKQFAEVFTSLKIHPDTEETDDEDSEEEEEPGNEDGQVRKRRGRLHARPKTLELILIANHFMTVDQIIDLVKKAYDAGVIKDKTIKNAVWDLTASNDLKKHYDKTIKEYIYGPPDWFEGETPKSQYFEAEQSEIAAEDEVEIIVDDYDPYLER